jgi:hypothetical protein
MLPSLRLREEITEAVHTAVCTVTGSDGMGHCLAYAATGMSLLRLLHSDEWIVQAGSAYILADPPDGYFCFEAFHSGSLALGEFHCWLARGTVTGQAPTTLVDFTARHYARMIDEFSIHASTERFRWTHGEPPPMALWVDGSQHPLAQFVADHTATEQAWRHVADNLVLYRELYRCASATLMSARPRRDP